jgi:hypothetical protein
MTHDKIQQVEKALTELLLNALAANQANMTLMDKEVFSQALAARALLAAELADKSTAPAHQIEKDYHA